MSNELKATKGPWRVENYGGFACDDSLIVDSEGEEVLGVSEWARVEDADLDMIAAAPEMYQELAEIRSWLDGFNAAGDYDYEVERIDTLLAKARGEKS